MKETIVYRENPVRGNSYEIGVTTIPIMDINRTGKKDWCDSRICETWDERKAVEICQALQAQK
jgi:hypothetical protein